jgi:hypothetical protein
MLFANFKLSGFRDIYIQRWWLSTNRRMITGIKIKEEEIGPDGKQVPFATAK